MLKLGLSKNKHPFLELRIEVLPDQLLEMRPSVPRCSAYAAKAISLVQPLTLSSNPSVISLW